MGGSQVKWAILKSVDFFQRAEMGHESFKQTGLLHFKHSNLCLLHGEQMGVELRLMPVAVEMA
jgi:hypothetical protein